MERNTISCSFFEVFCGSNHHTRSEDTHTPDLCQLSLELFHFDVTYFSGNMGVPVQVWSWVMSRLLLINILTEPILLDTRTSFRSEHDDTHVEWICECIKVPFYLYSTSHLAKSQKHREMRYSQALTLPLWLCAALLTASGWNLRFRTRLLGPWSLKLLSYLLRSLS